MELGTLQLLIVSHSSPVEYVLLFVFYKWGRRHLCQRPVICDAGHQKSHRSFGSV